MFLATTALTEFWDKEQELLCLGSWCLRDDRRQEWEGLRYRVMPSPWEDRARFAEAVAYLDACGERMLTRFADYLNAVHRVAYGTRYWRILLGPWLLHDLHAAYDRYVHLTEAFRKHPTARTILLDPQSFRVPRDVGEFITRLSDDPYNLQVVSQQVRHLGYAFPTMPWQEARDDAGQNRLAGVKQRTLRLAQRTARWVARGRAHVALCEMSMSPSQLWALAWKTGWRALPWDAEGGRSPVAREPIFDERRNGLGTLPACGEFERLFIRALPFQLPTLYLEGYHDARAQALPQAHRPPAVIVSAAGWHYQERFKFLAAEASARGSRLVAIQHGGGYGLFRDAPLEQHERRIADAFMAWGWGDGRSPGGIGNLPSPRLSSPSWTGQRRGASGKVVLVSTAHLRYLLRFHSCPVGIHTPAYLEWQVRFLAALPGRLRRVLRFRPYPHEYGYAVRDQITGCVGPLHWDGNQPFARTLRDARLVVIDHSGTTCLEALRAEVPTVLFWDPGLSPVRDEAQPYVEALRAARILHETPEAAAAHVAAIAEQPGVWWDREDVQAARQRFIERYALGRRDWLGCWDRVLAEEVRSARGSDGH